MLQLEINYTGHGGKPGVAPLWTHKEMVAPHKEMVQLPGSCPRDGCSVAKRQCGDNWESGAFYKRASLSVAPPQISIPLKPEN